MRCSTCGKDNPASNRYCGGCGARLAATCPDCGQPVSTGTRLCDACGVSFGGGAATNGRGTRATRIWGEIKQVTVLFADIAGSTDLVARLDPEQAMERLRPAVATMCEEIERFEGTVVRTLGDGVLALFGAPRAQEGHALLACEAALAMQQAFPPREDGIRIRVGLHSGAVVADAPLADVLGERSVHGVTAHVASRLQSIADPGTVFLTEECYRLVRPYCDVRSLGRRALRGVAGEVEIYHLLGLRPAVASQRFRGAALASFRGREHEFDALQRALQAAEDGKAGVVGIAGAPGTGKSRLCYEFAEWCRGRLIPVHEARAHPYGHAAPLQPVLEFLRSSFFRLPPSGDAAAARRRIAARLSGFGSTLEADLPVVYEFLGVSDESASPLAAPSRVAPTARHERLLGIVRRLVRSFGASVSVMIVEDLHWLDEASEAFVAAMVDAVEGTRTLLVLNYRPSYTAPWIRRARFHEIALAELPASATEALVRELVGNRAELAGLRRRVAERSGGNPFFAEELVRSLAKEGVLAGEQRDRIPGQTTGDGTLPTTVQAAIGARLDYLGASERTIIQIGAIIGKEFPVALLGQVAGMPQHHVDLGLTHLCDAELLQVLPSADGRRCAFRHPLMQEVAYATQLKARRGALHASVAAAMEAYYADRLDEFSALLAHHYEAAGQIPAAIRQTARAARWLGSNSPAQAIQHWRKVRELLQTHPASRDEDALRIKASAQIAWLGWREGLTADVAKPFIEEAIALAREADDSMVPLLLFADARIAGASGGAADAYAARVREALRSLRPGRDDGRAATLYAALSQAYGWGGLQREALDANDAALARVAATERFDQEFLGYSVEHWASSLRGRILGRLGRLEEAERCFAAMLGADFASEDSTVRLIPHLGGIDIAWIRGDSRAAEEHAARIAGLAESHGSPYLWAFAHEASGTAKGMLGDHAGAVQDFGEALRIVRTTRAANEAEAELLAGLADALLQLGEHRRAADLAREALDVAQHRNARLPECRACITLAWAIAAVGDPAQRGEVAVLLDRAEALVQLTGARLYETGLAHARSALAR